VSADEQVEVWYDGSCPLCSRSRVWAERRDERGRLVFHDLTDANESWALPAARSELQRALAVRRPGGALTTGFPAWCEVLSSLPRWRHVGGVLARPPLRWIGPAVYRLVARHRHRLAIAARDREEC
jgi:predicted DCC family thiol-disulfide oxidoreductase YuxK